MEPKGNRIESRRQGWLGWTDGGKMETPIPEQLKKLKLKMNKIMFNMNIKQFLGTTILAIL